MSRQDMPLPRTVGPKDMSFSTYQLLMALNRQQVITRIIAILALIVGCAALVGVVGIVQIWW
jgi:hypothetical protein